LRCWKPFEPAATSRRATLTLDDGRWTMGTRRADCLGRPSTWR
jgi:hypothetical protein